SPRAGRGRDQGVTAWLNAGPRAPLGFGGLREPVAEPARDRRVKAGEWLRRNMAKISRNWLGHAVERDPPRRGDPDDRLPDLVVRGRGAGGHPDRDRPGRKPRRAALFL